MTCTQKCAGLHVVVGILESGANEVGGARVALEILEAGKKVVVDEFHQGVTGDAFGVGAQLRQRIFAGTASGNRRGSISSSFLRVEDFEGTASRQAGTGAGRRRPHPRLCA